MKNHTLFTFFGSILLLAGMAGCQPAAVVQPSPQPILTNQAASTVTAQPPTEEASPTPTVLPTATSTPEPVSCYIVFDTNRDQNYEIYRVNADGSDPTNLSQNHSLDSAPAFSPDGSRIAFVSDRDGSPAIYLMDSDGSNVSRLSVEENADSPDWSHDGRMIVFSAQGDIFSIPADGNQPAVNLTNSPEEDRDPEWSPDGAKIAWIVKTQWGPDIFIMNADGSGAKQFTDKHIAYGVRWTPDGRIFTNWGWDGRDEFCQNCVATVDGQQIVDAGGKGGIANYFPFWLADGSRAEMAQTDLLSGNNDIILIGGSLADTLGIGIGSLNVTANPADDRNPDSPLNCGGGWTVDTIALEAIPTQPPAPEQILIGFAGDQPADHQRREDFQKACDELQIQCVYGEIPELLTRQVKALVVNSNPNRIADQSAAIRQAADQGVPVFVLEAEIDQPGVFSVTVDRAVMIGHSLEWMLNTFGFSGPIAVFDYDPAGIDTEIIMGLLEKNYPDIEVVTTDTEKYDINLGWFVIHDGLLKDYPGLKAIWSNANQSEIMLGVQAAGLPPDQWPVMTCGANKTDLYIWKDRLAVNPNMQCIAVAIPPGIAYDAAYTAFYQIRGQQINSAVLGGQFGNALLVDFTEVNGAYLMERIESIQYQPDDTIVDQWMTPDEIQQGWFNQ